MVEVLSSILVHGEEVLVHNNSLLDTGIFFIMLAWVPNGTTLEVPRPLGRSRSSGSPHTVHARAKMSKAKTMLSEYKSCNDELYFAVTMTAGTAR